jgi:hypothetical protein
MNKEKIIADLIEFIEGKTTFDDFWTEYQNNKNLKKLFEVKLGEKYRRFGNRTINENIAMSNQNTLYGKAVIYEDIYFYLQYLDIKCVKNDIYLK